MKPKCSECWHWQKLTTDPYEKEGHCYGVPPSPIAFETGGLIFPRTFYHQRCPNFKEDEKN